MNGLDPATGPRTSRDAKSIVSTMIGKSRDSQGILSKSLDIRIYVLELEMIHGKIQNGILLSRIRNYVNDHILFYKKKKQVF